MQSLIQQLIEESSVSPMGFGIHEFVAIKKINAEKVKKNDGSFAKQLFEITWLKKSLGESSDQGVIIKIFPLKHDHKPDTMDAVITFTYLQLANILLCYYSKEEMDRIFNPFAPVGIENKDQFKTVLNKKSNMDLFNKYLTDLFIQAATPLLYNDKAENNYFFRLKLITNQSGYSEMPKTNYIEPMSIPLEETSLGMTPRDLEEHHKAITPKTPDNLAKGAGAPPIPGGVPPAIPPMPGAVAPGAGFNPLIPAGFASAPAPAAPAVEQAPAPAAPQAPYVAPAPETAAPQAPSAPSPALPGAPFGAPLAPSPMAPGMNNPLGGIPGIR
jgi:hypothetical protein